MRGDSTEARLPMSGGRRAVVRARVAVASLIAGVGCAAVSSCSDHMPVGLGLRPDRDARGLSSVQQGLPKTQRLHLGNANRSVRSQALIPAGPEGQPYHSVSDKGACFVALDGCDETGDGTVARPFRTVAKAVESMTPGNTCYLRGGRYADSISLDALHGEAGAPLTFTAYPGETVIFDGTMPIVSAWERHKGSIYKTRLDRDIWQLFLDDEILTTARFPDANWADGSIWNLKASCRHLAAGSTPGLMVDERPPAGDAEHGELDDEGAEEGWGYLPDGVNEVSIAESGIDFTGAIAVMHIGSWLSWAQTVLHHEPGSDRFTYDLEFSKSGAMRHAARKYVGGESFFTQKNLKAGQGYFFFEGLQCLDQPDEWFYTPDDRTLYLYPSEGKSPDGLDVRGKVRTYSVLGESCAHLVFRGLAFFGTTFKFTDSHDILVEDCRFDYPSYNKLVLGDYRRPEVGGFLEHNRHHQDGEATTSRDCTVLNCVFRRMDGPAIELEGETHRIENCLFEEVDYTCLGSGSEGTINMSACDGAVFRHNTLHTTGNSEGIRSGKRNLIEFNHVYNMSLIQHDGSQINVGVQQQEGTVVRSNWSHDSTKAALRFDSIGLGNADTVDYGTDGSMVRNVSWRSGPMKVKGDRHVVVSNTGLWGIGDEGVTLSVLDNDKMGGVNTSSVTRSNIGVLSGHFRRVLDLPGDASHNQHLASTEQASAMLRDPANLDFRPCAGSPLVDAGSAVSGMADDHIGNAPDIGAYEYGDETYWIPGYRAPHASTPVPPDGSTTVKSDADLMWLGGYEAESCDVYVGMDRAAVMKAGRKSKTYRGRQASNIFNPGSLQPSRTYYWRIDSVKNGECVPGPIWQFTVQSTEESI